VILTPLMAPRANAYAERLHRTGNLRPPASRSDCVQVVGGQIERRTASAAYSATIARCRWPRDVI